MCGIIGYTGSGDAVSKITKGLSVLEYRGYDSVGLAADCGDKIETVKCKGRIGALEEKLATSSVKDCSCGIGHTRWATHGGPSDINAHPHRVGKTVLVHNGIIENYKELKEEFEAKGVKFNSETDTEVACALVNACYETEATPFEAISKACRGLTGSYAFGILFEGRTHEVWAIRCGSPLILAKGADGYYLASDMTALLPFTKEYHILTEGQIARLTETTACLFDENGNELPVEWSVTAMTPESAQKGGYSHFMLKEIHEQPEAIVKSVSSRIINGLPNFSADGIDADFWKGIKNIQIVACGSATYAGLVGSYFIEKLAKVPTASYTASEFRYNPPLAVEGTLVLLISQSGETADTLAALRYAKENGLPTLAIVNAVETTIAREADRRIYTYAGPEIAVATTKGYCTQVSVLYMIAAAMGLAKSTLTEAEAAELVRSIRDDAPKAIEDMIAQGEQLKNIASAVYNKEHVFYLGRGLDFHLSTEAALKLKEISYIHCEAYAAGELKHGTISLIEEGTPVIAISTEKWLYDKIESNVREVISRGADVTLLCRDDIEDTKHSANRVLLLPSSSTAATLFAAIAAIQLIAFEAAQMRGCDIDRPRNLAKSVTVE